MLCRSQSTERCSVLLKGVVMNEISNMPNDILARLFFRRLWQGYDSGGHSVGRSLQSSLLESYLALNEHEHLREFPLGLRDFAQEADARASMIHKQTIMGNLDDLSMVSSHDVSLLCLEALRVWYHIHADEKHPQGYGYVANTWEGRFVTRVCRIIPIPFFPYFNSDQDMLKVWEVAMDRVRTKHESEICYF